MRFSFASFNDAVELSFLALCMGQCCHSACLRFRLMRATRVSSSKALGAGCDGKQRGEGWKWHFDLSDINIIMKTKTKFLTNICSGRGCATWV
jgi:hypothetical protein